MNPKICSAIKEMKLIKFNYNRCLRIVEPHCYGINTAGNESLRAYQIGGKSNSKILGWKLFNINNEMNIILLDDTFKNPKIDYKRNDKGMKKIFCQL